MERKEYPANPIFNFEQNWTLFVDHLNTRYSGYKDKEDNFNLNVIDLGIKNYKNSFKKPEFEFQKKLVFEFYQIITSGHKINDIHNHINLESFSKIFALSCFFGSDHSLHFGDNTRIFYNNTNQLLELSPWDIGFGDIQKNTLCLKLLSKKYEEIEDKLIKNLFQNELIKDDFHKNFRFLLDHTDFYINFLTNVHKKNFDEYANKSNLMNYEELFKKNAKFLKSYYD